MAALSRQFVIYGPEQAKMLHAFLKQNAAAMAQAGKPLAVTVEEHKAKRSSAQNRRYWAILGQISESAFVGGKQFSTEAWAEHFKRSFIGFEELPDGSLIGISTTSLNTAEFTEYMDRIEAYAATELGLEIF